MKKYLRYLLLGVLLFSSGYLVSAEIEDLDTTDASNTARFPENMAPSAVNDGARALEGILARFHEDLGCRKSTTGSANAYVFAPARGITYYDGLLLCFDANFQTTGPATLNANSKGAAPLKRNGADIGAGAIETGQKVLVVYDGTNFEILSVARGITTYTDPITTRGDIIRGDSSGDVERLAVGNADEILGTDGTDAAWRAITSYVSTQADLEGASAITGYTSPGRQQSHPSAAKGWVKFSVAAATVVSFNVAGVSDVGEGDFTVNWDTAFSGSDYVVLVTLRQTTPDASFTGVANAITAGGVQIELVNESGTNSETGTTHVFVAGFGDQ